MHLPWDDEELDNNYEIVYDEGDEYEPPYSYQKWYKTDFSGVKLVNTNLYQCDLRSAENIEIKQLKEAKNWDDAIYSKELFKELGLPEKLIDVVEAMFEKAKPDDAIDLNTLIGSKVEIRTYSDYETKTKTKIKVEITAFEKRNTPSSLISYRYNQNLFTVKTLDGIFLDKIEAYNIYIYIDMDTLKS
jgi:hypothetical protein